MATILEDYCAELVYAVQMNRWSPDETRAVFGCPSCGNIFMDPR